jgi:predicted NBD/HSP70 family sugar kinase
MANGRRRSHNPRREHLQAILREALLAAPVTRRELALRLGLDPSTVSRGARPLIDAGLVRERMEQPGERSVRPGRRFRLLEIDPNGGQVLGIAIAPTVQTIALADIGQNVIAATDFAFEPVEDADRLIRRIALESRRLIGAHLADRSRLLGGRLMITAHVDPVIGNVLEARYLGWREVPLRARLADLLNLPMQIRMLMPTIIQAERLFGAARGHGNVLGMLCGLGIGVAVLVDGRPVAESRLPTGGIGFMTVTGEDGTAASLDELAGGLGILRRLGGELTAHAPLSQIDGTLHDAIDRDRQGNTGVAAEMARAGRELGRLVVQHAQFVMPEIVLIAGPLAGAPSYLAAIRATVDKGIEPSVEVVASRVTGAAGACWASCAMAVHDCLVEQPLDLSRLGSPPG